MISHHYYSHHCETNRFFTRIRKRTFSVIPSRRWSSHLGPRPAVYPWICWDSSRTLRKHIDTASCWKTWKESSDKMSTSFPASKIIQVHFFSQYWHALIHRLSQVLPSCLDCLQSVPSSWAVGPFWVRPKRSAGSGHCSNLFFSNLRALEGSATTIDPVGFLEKVGNCRLIHRFSSALGPFSIEKTLHELGQVVEECWIPIVDHNGIFVLLKIGVSNQTVFNTKSSQTKKQRRSPPAENVCLQENTGQKWCWKRQGQMMSSSMPLTCHCSGYDGLIPVLIITPIKHYHSYPPLCMYVYIYICADLKIYQYIYIYIHALNYNEITLIDMYLYINIKIDR